jgi:hypothetical protein
MNICSLLWIKTFLIAFKNYNKSISEFGSCIRDCSKKHASRATARERTWREKPGAAGVLII